MLGVHALLQNTIHLNCAKRASIHWAEDLDIATGIEFPSFRNTRRDEFEDGPDDGLGLLSLNKEKIRILFGLWHLTTVDPMRIHNDPTGGGLTKNFGEANDRHCATPDDIRENRSGTNARQLIHIPYKEHMRSSR